MTYRTRISEVNAVDSEIQLIMAFTDRRFTCNYSPHVLYTAPAEQQE